MSSNAKTSKTKRSPSGTNASKKAVQPAFVLLRGWGREKRHWADFPEKLQKQFPNHRVILLDLPGAGEFSDQRSPLQIREIREFLDQELQKRDVQGPIHFIAISLGGMIVLDFILNQPDRVQSAVIMNTSIATLNKPHERLQLKSLPHFARILKAVGGDREREILKMISNSYPRQSSFAETWAKVAQNKPVSALNHAIQLFAAATFRPSLKKVKQPVLWLVSQGDRLVDPICTERAHEAFGGSIERHPWAGHDLTLDDPDWVVEQVKSFWTAKGF